MNWQDPNKFDDYAEETLEQELERLELRQGHDAGNSKCYDGRPQAAEVWKRPERDYDDYDVKTNVITEQELEMLQGLPNNTNLPLMDVNQIEINWTWYPEQNFNPQEPKYVRSGRVYTRNGARYLLGVESYAEFSHGLHYTDKPLAEQTYDEFATAYALSSDRVGDFKFSYWIARYRRDIVPGFWMITIDDNRINLRTAIYYADGKLDVRENITFGKNSIIKIEK